MKQRLHPSLAEIDIATADDINSAMGHSFSDHLRDRWRTIKLMKFPQIRVIATGTTVTLAQSPSSGPPVGPDQGFIWMMRRVIVASNLPADTAKYTLYSGSDPGLFDSGHLLEGFGAAGQPVNQGYYPGSEAVWLWPGEQMYAAITGATATNQYVMSGIAVEVAAERVGALLALWLTMWSLGRVALFRVKRI